MSDKIEQESQVRNKLDDAVRALLELGWDGDDIVGAVEQTISEEDED